MAQKDDLAAQLQLMNKINSVLQSIASNQATSQRAIAGQVEYMQKMLAVLQQLQGLDVDEKFKTLGEAMNSAAEKSSKFDENALTKLANSASLTSDEFTTLADRIAKTAKSASVMGAAAAGLSKGLRNLSGLLKSASGFLMSVASWGLNVGAALLAIPLRILSGLINLAVSSTTNMLALRQEIENVRKEFGDLAGPGAGAVLYTMKTLRGFADTGLRAWRVFGTLAERLQFVREVATAMGSTFSVIEEEFRQNGGALLAYQKGLGAANEDMRSLAARSITFGVTLSKTMNDIAKQSLLMSRQFGLDQKLIARSMAKATSDVRHFGAMTVKELGVAAVYARKLGIELDKIVGTLDAFETFDSAAENAAKLSQSFGVQVDAFKLMAAQNPAEQIEMLRQQFRSAGVDASQFNRQQLRLLSSTVGLDEATAQQVFSTKNYGVSLNDIEKKAKTAEKTQLTQAEAMSKLADSIERMVKEGTPLVGSFWQMFIRGFMQGVQWSRPFREIMMNIRMSLRVVERAGRAVGRMFVEVFPGVKDALTGIAALFKPQKFRELGNFLKPALTGLMSGKKTFKQAADDVSNVFSTFFSAEAPAFQKAVKGFKSFFIRLADITGPAIGWVGEKIAHVMNVISDYISGKKRLGNADLSGTDQFFLRIFQPIFEGFGAAWDALKPAAARLFGVLFHKFIELLKSDEAKSYGTEAAMAIAAIVVSPALVNVLAVAGANALFKGLSGAVSGAFTSFMGGTSGLLRLGGAAVGVILGALSVSDAMDKYRDNLEAQFGETNAVIGTAIGGLVNTLTLGLLPDEWIGDISRAAASWQKSIDDAFTSIPLFGSVFTSVKDSISKIFEFVGFSGQALKNIFSSWSEMGGSTGTKTISTEEAKKRASQGFFGSIWQIGEDFGNSLADRVLKDKNAALKNVSDKVAAKVAEPVPTSTKPATVAASPISGDVKLPDAALGVVGDRMQNVSKQIEKAQKYIADIKTQAPKLAKAVSEGGVKTALDAVKDVVAMVQRLDDALASTPAIDIATKLDKFAVGSGLGSRAQYTVRSKEVVINLNLQVSMDVDKVEKVMVLRKESIIRDRLEFATIKAPGSQGAQSLPETYTDTVPNITRR